MELEAADVVPTYIVQMRQARTCCVDSMSSSYRAVQLLTLRNIFAMDFITTIVVTVPFTGVALSPTPSPPSPVCPPPPLAKAACQTHFTVACLGSSVAWWPQGSPYSPGQGGVE
jgi:hypothetical protein